MPRRHQYKWLGNQCIDQLRLDGLSKLSTVTLAVGDFLPTFGHVFGRAASPRPLAWQALLCHLPCNFGLNWDFAARDTRLDDRFNLGPNTSIAFDCSVAHEEMSVRSCHNGGRHQAVWFSFQDHWSGLSLQSRRTQSGANRSPGIPCYQGK
jgi:hypothetical protein